MKSKIKFVFDERSLESLDKLREQGRCDHEFTEVKLKNPKTGEERVLVLPHLRNALR